MRENIELGDARELGRLFAEGLTKKVRSHPRLRDEQARSQIGRATKPQCRCGRCDACKSDTDWNRIFEAKFADARYYYLRLWTRSPVSDF